MLDDILTQAAISTPLLLESFAINFHDNESLLCCLWLQPQQDQSGYEPLNLENGSFVNSDVLF